MKKFLSVLVGAVLLFGSAGFALAYIPSSYQINYTDSGGPQTSNVSAPSFPDNGDILGTDPTTGQMVLLQVGPGLINTGSGIQVSSIVADKVIIPDGDPLGYWFTNVLPFSFVATSTFNSYTSAISTTLGQIESATLEALGTSSTTNKYIASSTSGLMSGAMVTKLAALSTSTGQAYEGTTARSNSFPIFKSATIASGVAVVNLTNDGLSTGISLCPNGVIQDSVSVIFNDNTSSFQQSWAFSNSNKTLTITANKFTSANILSGLLGQAAANSSIAKVSVWCY